MKALLLHNDNLSFELIDGFDGLTEKYDYSQEIPNPNFNLDRSMSLFIKNYLGKEKFDVIFLPFSFSNSNYFELAGLRLAAHIRFTDKLPNSNIPIVFIGNETPEQINKISIDLGSILFTPGIFHTTKQSLDDVNAICHWISKTWYFRFDDSMTNSHSELTTREKLMTFNKIVINPPANYKSHHSIDNEFTLLKWSEYLGCFDKINEVKENISTGLYFKYLYSGYLEKINIDQLDSNNHQDIINFKLNEVVSERFKEAKITPKVVLIDDQYRAGWKDLFENYFSTKYNKDIANTDISVDFECFEHDFKSNVNRDNIVNSAEDFIKKKNPDVILLDLRLTDQDFEEESKPEDLTGFNILHRIKEKINRGIQVIIFTASNKAWNYEIAKSKGLDALSFIIKSRDSEPVNDFHKLETDVNIGLGKAIFLKKIYADIRLIKNTNCAKKVVNQFAKDFQSYAIQKFNLIQILADKNELDYCLFEYIKLLQKYCDIFTDFDKQNCIGYVYLSINDLKLKSNAIIILQKDHETKKIKSDYKYRKDFYPFQKSVKGEKDKQFVEFIKDLTEYNEGEIEFQGGYKLVAVLDRHIQDLSKINDLMELYYIRNNKIAHEGNFDSKKRIVTTKDIILIHDTVKALLNKMF